MLVSLAPLSTRTSNLQVQRNQRLRLFSSHLHLMAQMLGLSGIHFLSRSEAKMANQTDREVTPETSNQAAGNVTPAAAHQGVREVTDATFENEVLKSDQPALVDFWAAWCGPCKAIAPVVDEVADAYKGKARIFKMDVDKNASTPMRYNVRGIPTLLVFKGGQVKEQIVGYVSKDVIE